MGGRLMPSEKLAISRVPTRPKQLATDHSCSPPSSLTLASPGQPHQRPVGHRRFREMSHHPHANMQR
ncbi:hypothetical protein E2C01_032602 [Portunus trituberculatus]|uniref:Uncharacterized protein n=1 Tax=Portunus trituberculatus TaxID=210409 RepID=A0A5B7EXY3_PORTR|nr:hypothetical protein [Portunus trituberculatus]